MNYLVTGGAGFIGSKIAKKLLSEGHSVYIIDNLKTGYMENVPSNAVFEMGSVYDDTIEKFANVHFDAIIHMAGQSSGEISFEDPVYDIRTNAESTLRLIKFALKNNCKRFIYASSMSVYGAIANPDLPTNELAPTFPLSFYGVGKLASEHYLRIYQTLGIESTSLRFFNVYGPGQNLNNMKQGMVSIFLAYILNNQPIHVKGDKDRFRDFIYIDDVVDSVLTCLGNRNTIGKIYNVGTGVKTKIYEVVNTLIEACGHDVKTYPHFYQGSTSGDQFGIFADISKIKADTNWSPKTDLAKGIVEMVNYFKR